jgi:hypothetical protein
MIFPSLSFPFTLNVNRDPSKDDKNQPKAPDIVMPPSAVSARLYSSYDPVLLLLLMAVVMLSGAALVYAARH